jgi:hypothetical protein
MPLRVDRPADGAGDELVVFVARSLDEARAAREALAGAGVACAMPDAALEALFAQGAASVPVRVAPRDLGRAIDAIEARFPSAPVGSPLEEPAEANGLVGAGDDEARPDPRLDGVSQDAALDEVALDAAARRGQGAKLQRAASKVAAIAFASLLAPGVGALFGGFAAVGAAWCLRRSGRHPEVAAAVRRRAGVALAVGLASVVVNLLLAFAWLAHLGRGA